MTSSGGRHQDNGQVKMFLKVALPYYGWGSISQAFTKRSAIKKGGPLEEIKIVIIYLKWNVQGKCMILIGFLFYRSHGVSKRPDYRIDATLSRGLSNK